METDIAKISNGLLSPKVLAKIKDAVERYSRTKKEKRPPLGMLGCEIARDVWNEAWYAAIEHAQKTDLERRKELIYQNEVGTIRVEAEAMIEGFKAGYRDGVEQGVSIMEKMADEYDCCDDDDEDEDEDDELWKQPAASSPF